MWEVSHNGSTYNLQGKIGQGMTAEVYRATNKEKHTICVKIINSSFMTSPLGKNLIDNQINVLGKLSHPSLLKFIKKQQNDKKQLMIVTQYCSGGTLYEFMAKKNKLPSSEAIPIMEQVIEGCKYMHQQGYLHRDLKPENIFFKDGQRKSVKIADFGFAVNINNTKLINANVGSPLYMPYQSLSSKKFSEQSDVFAIGVIWYELLTGRTPFQAATERQLEEKTRKMQIRSMAFDCPPKLKELITKCLKPKPEERPSLTELLNSIEELRNLERTKSKSLYVVSQKESMKVLKRKNSISSKENKDPLFFDNKPNEKRSKRTITLLQVKDIKVPVLKEQKKSDSSISLLSKQTLLSLLNKLSEVKLHFLPPSVQVKFTSLLQLYQRLLAGKQAKKGEGQVSQDELILSLALCQNQQDFCISSFPFLRRLLRLAKTYKAFTTTIDDLSTLWNHVQAKCLVK